MLSLFFLGPNDPILTENGPFAPYTFGHIIITLLAFALIALLVSYAGQKTYRTRFLWVSGAYCLMLLLNAARFIWEISLGEFSLQHSLPLQLCGIQMLTLPFALYSKGRFAKYARDFSFAYGILGFALSLLMPYTTLFDYPLLHFRSVQSILYHASLGFICLMLPRLNFVPNIKNIRRAYLVLVFSVALTGIVNAAIGSNYLYTAWLPLPSQLISWPYYLPFLIIFGLLIGRIPYYAYAILQVKNFPKQKNLPQH